MLIIRTQTKENNQVPAIRTFTFDSEKDMKDAMAALITTRCKGFAAVVNKQSDKRGKILASWDRSTRFFSDMQRTVQSGAYRDEIWEVFGLKDECQAAAEKTNARATTWASVTAKVQHVAGDLFKTVYRDPYKD